MIITAVVIVVILIIAATAVVLISRPSSTSGKAPPEIATYAKDWPLPGKDYSNSRATKTSTINSQTAGTLGPAWSYKIPGIGGSGGATCTPLILGDTVLFQDGRANVIALNLQTGAVKWSKIYNASFVEGPNGVGVGYGKVFLAKDAYTMAALDLNTGQELWTNKLSNVVTTGIDIQPLVYDKKVYTSTVPGTGDIFYKAGGIGVIIALDESNGKQEWNFSTVKGNLWGHPEVNSGGGCWYTPALDTETGTMFWSIANPAPFAGAPGWPSGSSFDTALYTDTLVALDHSTGKLKWFNQLLGHDIWDHDLQIGPILTRATIHGEAQDIVLVSGKMGNVYALNRETGATLWTVPVGEHMNDLMDPITEPTTVLPGVIGGVETPMAYADGMVFVPVIDLSTEFTPTGLNASSIDIASGRGELVAINVTYGHIEWVKHYNSINVGAATVVNDVVFTAEYSGIIHGYNTKTGQEVFRYKAPAGINAWPAVAGDTIVWPCGVGGTPSVIALKVGKGTPAVSSIPPEVSLYAKDWPLPGKDYNNSRATKTSKINSTNVNTLGIAWHNIITGLGGFGGATCTPLILGDTVLFQDAKANVFAYNLTTGATKWSKIYNASFVEGPNGVGVGYGKVFLAKDAYTMAALDLNTGQELWTNRLSYVPTTGIDIQPLVYDGMVYTSTVPGTGDIFYSPGGIGVIYALDQGTGSQAWNFSTVKGNLWGHPEVNSGGGCWYTPAVDTATGVMYWDVANPAPFAGAPGWPSGSSFDNALYTDSCLAIEHFDGSLQWYTQALGHDIWDHDLEIGPILTRANVLGVTQDIVLCSGKMGVVYALNRDTGALLWSVPVGKHSNDTLDPITGPTTVLPGVLGGVETPMAYADGMVYVPIVDMSTQFTPTGLNGSSIDFANATGELVAVNVSTGHIAWVKNLPHLNVGGATVVNDVVFTADFSGMIYGFHAKTGAELFRYLAPAGINAWPAVAGDTIVWPCGSGATPSVIALRLNGGPNIMMTSPVNGANVASVDVRVNVSVNDFTLVAPTGQPNVAGQGHIHYFLDALPPTTPGVPAIPVSGGYVVSTALSNIWTNVSVGKHILSVELVNNDHTPLVPAVADIIYVEVVQAHPGIKIVYPIQGATVYGRNVTIDVSVEDFLLVNNLGGTNVAGEGHIHYFMDVLPPTTPGVPAFTASGTYAATAATTYIWRNVTLGPHMFSVELVNNDHTPLVPPAYAFLNVTVVNAAAPVTVYLSAHNLAFNVSMISVPRGANVTVVLDNLDSGVPHNFALYTDSTATTLIFRGSIVTGVAIITYNFIAPGTPGNYFFRCDVHPNIMTGTFMVT
jgi:outer membrane protein assembly factor BamB